MKNLSIFFAAAFLSITATAGNNFLGNLGAALEGQQRANQEQRLQQCVSSCRPGDGQCYQGCAMAFSSQPSPQMPQMPQTTFVPREPQLDNQCFQACTQAGYQYGLCKSKCSY